MNGFRLDYSQLAIIRIKSIIISHAISSNSYLKRQENVAIYQNITKYKTDDRLNE